MSTTTRRAAPPADWKEGRRLRALVLHEQGGGTGKRIAEALGVSPGAVSQWLTAAREGGAAALRRRPRGRTAPKLSATPRGQLPDLLRQGAEAYGFIGQVWTTGRVAEVIWRAFGVRHHPAPVSRILKAIRWTVQKPIQRASQRNEAAIAAFREERQPSLGAKPRRRGAPSSMSMSPASLPCRL
jgi:transposase